MKIIAITGCEINLQTWFVEAFTKSIFSPKIPPNSFETCLGRELLARSLAASRFASRLLGAGHHEMEAEEQKNGTKEVERKFEN